MCGRLFAWIYIYLLEAYLYPRNRSCASSEPQGAAELHLVRREKRANVAAGFVPIRRRRTSWELRATGRLDKRPLPLSLVHASPRGWRWRFCWWIANRNEVRRKGRGSSGETKF